MEAYNTICSCRRAKKEWFSTCLLMKPRNSLRQRHKILSFGMHSPQDSSQQCCGAVVAAVADVGASEEAAAAVVAVVVADGMVAAAAVAEDVEIEEDAAVVAAAVDEKVVDLVVAVAAAEGETAAEVGEMDTATLTGAAVAVAGVVAVAVLATLDVVADPIGEHRSASCRQRACASQMFAMDFLIVSNRTSSKKANGFVRKLINLRRCIQVRFNITSYYFN